MSEEARVPIATEPQIRPFRRSDSGIMVAHFVRQTRESGRDGLPHFAPRLEVDRDEVRAALERRVDTPLDEPDWGRAFLLVVPEIELPRGGDRVVGLIDMRGGRLRAGLSVEFCADQHDLQRGPCIRAVYRMDRQARLVFLYSGTGRHGTG